MAEICEFRTAKLKLGADNLTFVVEASIREGWDTVTFPVFKDQPFVRTIQTVKNITASIRRKYQPSSPLHAALDGSPLTLEFVSGGETHSFALGKVTEWKVYGELGGEMMEEVTLSCEEEE